MLMQWSLKILLIIIIYNSVYVASFFEGCDTTVNLTPTTTHIFQSKNYSLYDTRVKYAAGTSCVVQYIAPHGYIVRVTGIISLDLKIRIPNCSGQGQRFFISRNGNKKFSDADVFCGTDTIDLDSVGNQMSVGYISDVGGQGRFQVFANAMRISNENCNCGWGLYYKYGKMETSRRYKGYTSTVGILHVEKDEIVCTGVIITTKYIVSSANCYYKSTENIASTLHVLTGYKEYPSDSDQFYSDIYEISSIKNHENYADTTASQQYDIAILTTKIPMRFTRAVSPVCLAFAASFYDEDFYDERTFEMVGWNKYNNDGLQQFLETNNAIAMENTKCASNFKTLTISNSQLCLNRYNATTIYPEYPGAALFFSSGDKKFLIGLFNLQLKSTNAQPLVFTRVSRLISWIRANIGNEFVCYRYF
ncbi:venom serine protease-like [Chironomus tepperi]|uniref:venom serine protease-like n=1 Tax=Chironomus tepperi TaxID=113505 RepID=UPI00391F8AB3